MQPFRILLRVIGLVCLSSLLLAQPVQYTLIINQPYKHLATVHMDFAPGRADSIDLNLPVWSPGRYVRYDFSKNIFDFYAENDRGELLPVQIINPHTRRIRCSGQERIHVRYKVFAHTLDGTFSFIDSAGASLNGSGLFMYIKNEKYRPALLEVKAPQNWQVVSSLSRNKQGLFEAANYDRLIDSPIECGKLFLHSFRCLGKKHTLVFHKPLPPKLLNRFTADLKKVITKESRVFGDTLPYDHYTFFFHLLPALKHPDGMEHLNSCRVLLRMNVNHIKPDANTDPDYDNLIWLSAHEFFHTWNIKRLRPKGLGPFDYTGEVCTPSLWIVEGLTSYYAYLALVRSGIYTPEKLFSEFSGRINRYENDPGKTHRTLAEVSMLTWLFKGHVPRYAATNIDETTYSYYYKGLIVGLLLDLNIRSLTRGNKSLDDVMRRMYDQYYRGKKTNYYLPGKGYTEADFEQMANTVVGANLDTFFRNSVRQIRALNYRLLNAAGLQLVRQKEALKIKQLVKSTKIQQKILDDWLSGR